MKNVLLKFLMLFAFLGSNHYVLAQKDLSVSSPKYPTSFIINNSELDALFKLKKGASFKSKQNIYLNGAQVILNSAYKENKQLKLKLSYFKNAEMFVQINGKDSKIIYILTSDDSVFYNSKVEGDKIILTQCHKDDILSE